MSRPLCTTPSPQTASAQIAAAPPAPRPRATLALTSAATAVALMTYIAPMVTLPDTTRSLGTALWAQAWLLNGAPLGLSALLLIAGSLADDHGRRRVFLAGTLAAGVTTALGALASSTWLFVAARIAQGAASAAVLAASLGLLVHAFPSAADRARATGIWGAFVSGGLATGPLLAGSLAMVDWRWAYAVLGLAGVLITVIGRSRLAESRAPRPGRPDVGGALALSLALAALLAALTLGRTGWLRPSVGILLLAAVVLTVLFWLVERRVASPMIDLGLLRRPLFLAASSGALFIGLAVTGLLSFLPTLLQGSLGMSPMDTAWLFSCWAGIAFLVGLQARRLVRSRWYLRCWELARVLGAGRTPSKSRTPSKAGAPGDGTPGRSAPLHPAPRHQLAAGFVLHAVGALAMLGAVPSGHWMRLLPGLVISGAGSGLLNSGLPLLVVESVPGDRAAMGSGANSTVRYIGSAAGVALTIAVATALGGDHRPGRAGAMALARGADLALVVSAGLAVLAAVGVLLLRDRPEH